MNTHGQSWSGGGARRWPVVLAWVLALAAVAAFLVVLLGGNSTTVVRTVIVPTPVGAAPVTVDTQGGALTDAEAFWTSADAAAGNPQTWTLAYRVDSFTPSIATLESWALVTGGGQTGWQRERVTIHYANGRWQPVAGPNVEIVADPSVDPSSPRFDGAIASFRRFPGVP